MRSSFLWLGCTALIGIASAIAEDLNRQASDVVANEGSGIQVDACFPEPDPPKIRDDGEPLDPLTQELLASLRDKSTVAMWLFDASATLKSRRNLVADRFDKIHRLVNASDAPKLAPLSTVVASFGKDYQLITKEPVTDIRAVIPKIRAIEEDDSGKEMVFNAVKNLASSFHKHRNQNGGQNLLMFIVTDERGDDPQLMEEAISLCRRYGIRVYVMGNASLLGRDDGYVPWKDDDGVEHQIPVDSGPESYEPELVILPSFGVADLDLSRLSSGFGPYALSRLCRETAGKYYIWEESPKAIQFPHMRAYAPDYRPIQMYKADMERSPCKQSLVAAARLSRKLNTCWQLPVQFRADTDAVFKERLTEAEKPFAVTTYSLNTLLTQLKKGEADRSNLKELRWRAEYDLAIGSCLAMKARCLAYEKTLAEMRDAPKRFDIKGSNQWKLELAKESILSEDVRVIEKQALKYLKRCADEHPETPWALLAQHDMNTPIGWQWKEATADYEKQDREREAARKKIEAQNDLFPLAPLDPNVRGYDNSVNRLIERRLDVLDQSGKPARTGPSFPRERIGKMQLKIVWTDTNEYGCNYVLPEFPDGKEQFAERYPSPKDFLKKTLNAQTVSTIPVPDTPYAFYVIDGKYSVYFLDSEKMVVWQMLRSAAHAGQSLGAWIRADAAAKTCRYSGGGGDFATHFIVDFGDRWDAPKLTFYVDFHGP